MEDLNPQLFAVRTFDGKRLWAVGEGGTILASTDGEHWKSQVSGTNFSLYSIFGTGDGKRLWAVGRGATILVSTDGEHWNSQASGTRWDFESIFGTSDGKRLWAVANGGTILASTDGEHWNSQNSGTQKSLYSIFGTSDGKRLWVVGEDGTILTSTDWEHWKSQVSGTNFSLSSIFGTSDGKRLWAVGDKGTILASTDGEHWNSQNSGTQKSLHSIFGTSDGKRLWAVSERIRILESTDEEHWNDQTSGTQGDPHSIFGTSDGKRLWAVGGYGTILESTDGEHWNSQASGTQNHLHSIFGTSDGKRLWVVGEDGTILTSTDGEHWNSQNSGTQNHLHSIFGTSDGKRLWVVGEDGTILTSTDGEHWKSQDSGTNFSLSSIFGTSDGKRLWAVGLHGTILKSTGGELWDSQDSGTIFSLNSIFGTSDGERLWAVGSRGTVLASRDGEHWISQDSGRQYDLRSIFGTSDGKRLWAVGTSGTILESADGEHWNWNRQVSAAQNHLASIFGTSDGKRLWVVGENGGIRRFEPVGPSWFLREAQITGASLDLRLEPSPVGDSVDYVTATGVNDYDLKHNVPGRDLSCNRDQRDSNLWACQFQPSDLRVEFERKLHFLIDIKGDHGTQQYEFNTTYDPWAPFREHARSIALLLAVFFAVFLPAIFLYVQPLWNLWMYRVLKLNRIEKIDVPVIGDFVQVFLRLVTVLPWFVMHPRTQDAWLGKHSELLCSTWPESTRRESEMAAVLGWNNPTLSYVPLPIRVGSALSGTLIEQPGAADFRQYALKPRFTLQIVGPGGAGKTTLARQLGDWAMENSSNSGIASHPMLPVWVDEELDADRKPLSAVVLGKLRAALPDDEVEEEFCLAMLKRQRLLVIIDRVSERSPSTQHYVETIYRSTRIGCLILTSRSLLSVEGTKSTVVYPQPLDSKTLLHFMTALLNSSSSSTVSEDAARTPLSNIREQLSLGERLATLLGLTSAEGEKDIPLVPLHVRLFVEEAIRLTHERKSLDNLPVSLPEVYFRYLRRVNPDDPSVPNFLDGDRMLKTAQRLGKVAIGKDFIPKEFSRDAALSALKDLGEKLNDSCDPIARLVLNGILIKKPGGLTTLLRFSLDPVAEFLAAAQYAEEAGGDASQWDSLLRDSKNAPGFWAALMLTRQAYGKEMGWALPHSG